MTFSKAPGKRHFVGTEIEGKHLHNAADERISAGGMVGIIRRVDERLPVDVTDGLWIAVEVAFIDRGDAAKART